MIAKKYALDKRLKKQYISKYASGVFFILETICIGRYNNLANVLERLEAVSLRFDMKNLKFADSRSERILFAIMDLKAVISDNQSEPCTDNFIAKTVVLQKITAKLVDIYTDRLRHYQGSVQPNAYVAAKAAQIELDRIYEQKRMHDGPPEFPIYRATKKATMNRGDQVYSAMA